MANWWDSAPVVKPFDLTAALGETDRALGLPPGTSAAQIKVESGFNPRAVSPAGAMGLAQVMPATLQSLSERMGRKLDPYSPADAVEIHREVMRENISRFKSLDKALMAYNGGWDESRWKNPETSAYVGKVSAAMKGDRPMLERAVSAVIPSAQAAPAAPQSQSADKWWESAPVVDAPTNRQRMLASPPMRLAKGMKDPIDGAAQLIQQFLPASVVRGVNRAADAVGGDGTFIGDVLGIKGMTPQQMSTDIRSSNAEYEQARAATGQQGFDGVRFAGNIVSPVNAGVGRVLPVPKIGEPLKMLAAKGATAGAAGAATQPVMEGDYWTEKGLQTGTGALMGAAMTPAMVKAADSAAKAFRARFGSGAIDKTPQEIAYEIKVALQRDDIDAGQIPKHVMDQLTREVQGALRYGEELNAAALLRKMDFNRVGVQPLKGQLTRDPTQFTQELNLRGVQGAGEPIANRLNEQAATIASRFRKGTAGAQDPFDAGQTLISRLQSKNASMEGDVRSAYQTYRDSTGRDLPVPMDAIRSGYKEVLSDFDDHIPGAVRKKFEALVSGPKAPHSHGPLAQPKPPLTIVDEIGNVLADFSPKPAPKSLSIDEAEKLIKTINNNYDPSNKPQALALDKLRKSVQDAILGATESGEGMEAATLANFARDKARQRFQAIDSTPALKAAINAAEPDDFIKKYVINGKVRELNALAKMAGPDGQKVMAQQTLKYLENKAFGANAAGDAPGRQASFNQELNAIGRQKLAALVGPEMADDLFAVGRVMAYIQQQPAGAAVNNSNTGAMVASLLGKVGGTIKGAPYINDLVIKPIDAFRNRSAVQNALAAQLSSKTAELDPESVNALARLMRPVPQAAGTALGYSVR